MGIIIKNGIRRSEVKVGILTSGGDCQALNAAMYGLVKGLYEYRDIEVQIYGIEDGYTGLIEGRYKIMSEKDFEEIQNIGGTILGSSRQPFKKINEIYDGEKTKLQMMIDNYRKLKLDCLVILGGNGSHKVANLLAEKGLNIITLPKTIDNDIYGTDMTFGYATATDRAVEYIDNLKSTAKSHKRIFIVEVMGNKAGWLTLNVGIATGADVVLIPEIPYDVEEVSRCINQKIRDGKKDIIVTVAEGIMTTRESKMSGKELKNRRGGETSSALRLEKQLRNKVNREIRKAVIGHIQRGGNPNAYDRVLATRLGVMGARAIIKKQYGNMMALVNGAIINVPLKNTAGKKKIIENDSEIIKETENLGINLGR